MLALETLIRARRVYDAIIAVSDGVEALAEQGRQSDLRPLLREIANLVRSERPVVLGVISTLTAVQAAMAEAKAPAGAVIPLPTNDNDHGLSAPSETPPNIA